MGRTSTDEHGNIRYKYSEIFHSFQGEGAFTGRSTAWIRFFMCNLTCNGFGQKDPTNPDTYVLPYKDFDVDSVDKVEDLPVWDYGCDSSYTWAKKFKHLMADETAPQICDKISNCFSSLDNPRGLFLHPSTGQDTHMAFTGGEPMLNQDAIDAILYEFERCENLPRMVTVETNGTQQITNTDLMKRIESTYKELNHMWFWSVSPKLWSTSGEKESRAIKPDVVGEYARLSDHGQLKYVVNGTEESWQEVEEHTKSFRDAGVYWDVYIMPVGATKEQQEDRQIADICMEAMRRGYHVSGRLHCYVFGNQVGT